MEIIIENIRGQWVVDDGVSDEFAKGDVGYSDGALIKLEVTKAESLCHHPNNPVVCEVCK